MLSIRRVAVLGAGTMGSRIAAQFANAGIPVRLLDLNDAAVKGLEIATRQRPPAFMTEAAQALVTPGNIQDDLDDLATCDWIIEAVTERLDIKRALWERVDHVRKPGAILSTNTSGIPLEQICHGFSKDFRRHFLGTHFFNPPRYLHLVEIIPGPDTDAGPMRVAAEFCDVLLGKGVVPCKDTPNFIANRIGSFFGSTVYKLTIDGDYTIEEVEALTGPLIGLPRTASYRLLDVVGIDVWEHVSSNLYASVPDDPWRERFLPPPFLRELVERRWLGDKSGQGFYKRVGSGSHVIDWKTLEYHEPARVELPSIDAARQIDDLPERLRALVAGDDRAGRFLWSLFSDVFLYSAERIPEIADRVVEIDRAMRWGYAHTYGPFELWDALGFVDTCERLEREGRTLPDSIVQMRSEGAASFYRTADRDGHPHRMFFHLQRGGYGEMEERPGILVLADHKRARGVVKSTPDASLVDLGDGVLCCEFHSKMNALNLDTIAMIHEGISETERNFLAMVIANQSANFSSGANLMMILLLAQEGDWDQLGRIVHAFQQCNLALKNSTKPVVAAPFNRTLGAAAELVLHCTRAQASAELYMGLVETSVGLIPAGGGCQAMLQRLGDPARAFQLIAPARLSSSAPDARQLGLLDAADQVSMNAERLVHDAKSLALSIVPSHGAWPTRALTQVEPEALIDESITGHDLVVAQKLAHVLTGPLEQMLDLEREAFLSLCGEKKTQNRIEHTLKTGKALRN